jgi:hypothetical protein
MLSIMAVLGSDEFRLLFRLVSHSGSQTSTGKEGFAGGSAVLATLNEGLEIELTDCAVEYAMLKGDCLWQVVEIVIGEVPTAPEIHFMYLFMSLGRILLQGSVSMNLFDPVRHQVDIRKIEVGIQLLGNIYPAAHRMPPGAQFAPLLGHLPSFSICLLNDLSLLHVLRSQAIGFDLRLFASLPEKETIFQCVKSTEGIFHAAQYCIIMRFILSIHIEF